MKAKKDAIITSDLPVIENLYPGKQYNCSTGVQAYNYATDVFKLYGFNTCLRWDAPTGVDPSTKFMAYSYLFPVGGFDVNSIYTLSMYFYVSEDCNANFNLIAEQGATIITPSGQTTKYVDKTKGKAIWLHVQVKPNTKGQIYLMFYPNTNGANVFTTGYQLFAGITFYKGTEIICPMCHSVNDGVIEANACSIGKQNVFSGYKEY